MGEYDPNLYGQGAGEMGGKRGAMNVSLSDKAAKDYSDAMKAAENTSKAGGFTTFASFITKMIDASPAAEIFSMFVDVFMNKMFAQIDWANLVTIFTNLSEIITPLAEKIASDLNPALKTAADSTDALTGSLGGLKNEGIAGEAAMKGLTYAIGGVPAVVADLDFHLNNLKFTIGYVDDKLDKFKDTLDDLAQKLINYVTIGQHLTGGAGGAGGGGGGDWWDNVVDFILRPTV